MSTTTNKAFLKEGTLPLLANLKEDAVAKFGIMTPQHMVEHLLWVTKATIGRKGEMPAEPTKSHLYFQKFIAGGAKFKHPRTIGGISCATLSLAFISVWVDGGGCVDVLLFK